MGSAEGMNGLMSPPQKVFVGMGSLLFAFLPGGNTVFILSEGCSGEAHSWKQRINLP
jgi:hypothetical protein